MKCQGGWNPIGGRKHYTVKDYGGEKESEKKLHSVHVTAVVLLLVIIGAATFLLAINPGVLELAKSLLIGIGDMLRNIAEACSDFVEYVKHQSH